MFEGIIAIIAAILGVILFFKIWTMTNDVRDIKERLSRVFPTDDEKQYDALTNAAKDDHRNPDAKDGIFAVGDKVIHIASNTLMVVKDIRKDGSLECYAIKKNGTEEYVGLFNPSQLKHCK